MLAKLTELLKDAETLDQVFKQFENGYIHKFEFVQGKVVSARKDYSIINEICKWKPEIEAIHPYGTNILYAFQKQSDFDEKQIAFFKSLASQE